MSSRQSAHYNFQKTNGCEVILMQAYSLELKQKGNFDPRKRGQRVSFNGPWLGASAGECNCGCGNPIKGRQRVWAHPSHASLIYFARDIVENPNGPASRIVCYVLQGGNCALCQSPISVHEGDIDHIKEVAEGGGGCWIDNLQLVHSECHRKKTGRFLMNRSYQKFLERHKKTEAQNEPK